MTAQTRTAPDGGGLRMDVAGPCRRFAEPGAGGAPVIYGLGMPFQVSPTEIAVQMNRRPCGVPVVDIEDGSDLFIAGSVEALSTAAPIAFLRNEPAVHPRTGRELIMVKYPAAGGFVPLGARLADGRPHPHAGTGFSLGIALGYPADHSVRRPEREPDTIQRFELLQHAYEGSRFGILSREPVEGPDLFPGWVVHRQALGGAIPSGEDLLFCHVAMRPGAKRQTGVARWRRGPRGWRPGDFVPVSPPDNSSEPSLVRDLDGALLVCVRTGEWEDHSHFRVFRSTDEGASWSLCVDDPGMRGQSPVSIGVTLDGRPFLAANPYRRDCVDNLGRTARNGWMREDLQLFLLTDDRRHVRIPFHVFDARARFGPAREDPGGHVNFWYVDHPLGGVFRLADGRWHGLMAFRVGDLIEVVSDAQPPDPAGCWIGELESGGVPRPPWSFG